MSTPPDTPLLTPPLPQPCTPPCPPPCPGGSLRQPRRRRSCGRRGGSGRRGGVRGGGAEDRVASRRLDRFSSRCAGASADSQTPPHKQFATAEFCHCRSLPSQWRGSQASHLNLPPQRRDSTPPSTPARRPPAARPTPAHLACCTPAFACCTPAPRVAPPASRAPPPSRYPSQAARRLATRRSSGRSWKNSTQTSTSSTRRCGSGTGLRLRNRLGGFGIDWAASE